MIVKLHKHQDRMVLAVCDDELLGKTFKEGNRQLDLNSGFYNGDICTAQEAADLMRNVDHLNLVGEKTIKIAKEEGLVDDEHIMTVKGIPYTQVVIVRN